MVILSDEVIALDVLGERCPMPVQRIRRALKKLPQGSILQVIGDDPESLHDIPVLLSRLGKEPATIKSIGSGWLFEIIV